MKNITFDDVLIKPLYSEINPNDVVVRTKLTKNVFLDSPIISSAMDTVTEFEMARTIAEEGGIGFLHHNMSMENQIKMVFKMNVLNLKIGMTFGFGDIENADDIFMRCKPTVIILDNAHAHTKKMLVAIENIIGKCKKNKIDIIVGNVATKEAAEFLIDAGVDAIKVGIGSGSICTTRIVTGIGVPQLSAIRDIFEVTSKFGVPLIADGGMRNPGDFCKAIAAGAQTAVFGSVFAGTKEAPGEIINTEGGQMKNYRGMGSKEAMKFGSKERYNQDYLNESDLTEEGVNVEIPYKGNVRPIIQQFIGGLKNSMAYIGAKNIQEYQEKAKFIEITNASFSESLPHIFS